MDDPTPPCRNRRGCSSELNRSWIVAAGLRFDGVNLMAMDDGDSAAPPARRSTGQDAIDAANASFRQLSELFASHGEASAGTSRSQCDAGFLRPAGVARRRLGH